MRYIKLCECGCGQKAPLAKRTRPYLGHVKGEPTRYAQGHSRPILPAADRFWPKVEKTEDCWVWTGAVTDMGYGSFYLYTDEARKDKKALAHRWAYEDAYGPIPTGLQVDHLCRNRRCVRPDHLEPVTPRENVSRGMSLGAVTVRTNICQRGHELTPENTVWQGPGKRSRACRECRRLRDRRRSAA